MDQVTGQPTHIKDVLDANSVRYNWGKTNRDDVYENLVINS